MLHVYHTAVAAEPLFHGSDEKLGTLRTFRRETVLLPEAVTAPSRFPAGEDGAALRRNALSLLLLKVWNRWEDKARVTIYDELAGHLLAATATTTKQGFFNLLLKRLGIRSLTEKAATGLDAVDLLDLFSDEELLQTIRAEHQYILAVFRKLKDDDRDFAKSPAMLAARKAGKVKKGGVLNLFDADELQKTPAEVLEEVLKEQVYGEVSHPAVFSRHTETVPVVSGNGIRGVLRRLAHYDFCQRVGITRLAADRYHQLFTGGAITGETGEESLEARRAFIAADPMLGLFGSAIGNQTMHGALVVGQASPECREKGTGPASYHEMLEIVFGTRLDSEKLESQLTVVGVESKERATQMLYQYETLVAGTRLRHHFALRGNDPLLTSAFWHLLSLFVATPYVAARAAIGHGALGLSELAAQIPAGGAELYVRHLADNQESIRAFFAVN